MDEVVSMRRWDEDGLPRGNLGQTKKSTGLVLERARGALDIRSPSQSCERRARRSECTSQGARVLKGELQREKGCDGLPYLSRSLGGETGWCSCCSGS